MARIVLACAGSHGDLFPYLGLAQGLAARGHTPIVATSPVYRPIVAAAGLAFHAIRPDIDPGDSALLARVMHPTRGPEVVVREIAVPATRVAYDDLLAACRGTDLLVAHPIAFAAPLAGEKLGLPWVSTALAPLMFFARNDFPALPNMPWSAPAAARFPWIGRALLALGRRIVGPWAEPVIAFRRELGLPDRGHPMFEGQFSPWGTLAMFSPALGAPQPDWPARTEATGFVHWNDALAMPPELDAFLDAGPPPAVFTLGSTAVGAAGDFYAESRAAVARLGLRAVLLVGDDPRNRAQAPLPPGVIEIAKAPHAKLLPRALVTVHHGGVGTTGQAMHAGRPMLVVPHSHDQPDNAYRVGRLGIARTLRPARYRASAVADALAFLAHDPATRARAAEVGDRVRAEDGPGNAVRFLEAVLSRARG